MPLWKKFELHNPFEAIARLFWLMQAVTKWKKWRTCNDHSLSIIQVECQDYGHGRPELRVSRMFVINVTNINEPPFDISLSSTSVRENLPVGQVLGELSAEDDDSTNVGLFSILFQYHFFLFNFKNRLTLVLFCLSFHLFLFVTNCITQESDLTWSCRRSR